ncbi:MULTISPECIES: MBL fold metallo-hydrolase [unclassified Saccharibacter]|uniref:MBL fold metallo-hydrolase n=1 Tax=unclassified Saccharibacter TaxID=2648722 RepID=UPI00132A15EA|nr:MULTISPECIES: 3',5'-cyclic-nucleotide phosphodiesterase [unclassified Saccharibacter]MXV36709.1 3',5'-cyclic-nucleotide phosphodiesterase [Saccharibacter sp. EH611]MXV58731.1 3',5'-cyclic-nucleotide phosphodiesterase [Saccharibacter sp. EH70]MXV65657.1 3',5'-cyclic-nucleotide phosphodiesterase [Saccharibacter sp. EH60]
MSATILSSLRGLIKKAPSNQGPAFADTHPDFEIIALGTRSGVIDGNLTSYMVRPLGRNEAVLCDAGTLGHGLKIADQNGSLDDIPIMPDSPLSRAGHVLKQTIRAYLISHPHLDHMAGLILTSPDDTPKPIYGLPSTLNALSAHLFNNEIWGNQGDRGAEPVIGKYRYQEMESGIAQTIADSDLTIRAWPLKHGPITSTAFLIETGGKAVLYLGDTEADKPENDEQHLHELWKAVAPLVKEQRLKAIVMEATYNNDHPESALAGHMTPQHVLDSLRDLALVCGGRHHVRGLKVLITHVKETFQLAEDPVTHIARELNDGNDMGIYFLMAKQGERYLV